MRATIAIAATTVALACSGAGAVAAPMARTACSRDTPAIIDGAHKCLGPGEYCRLSDQRQYERYGFICSRSYHPPRLRRR
jgi:hypothetical protein